MTKVKNKYTKKIYYFRFFATEEFDDCFWYTKTTDSEGFELGFIKNFEPIGKTWQELRNGKKI